MRHFLVNVFYQEGEAARRADNAGGQAISAREKYKAEHTSYVNELGSAGTIICAGPLLDGSGGLFVLAAEDDQQARQVMDADPYVVHGVFARYDLAEFERHQ